MTLVLYPGSFDPITFGHLNIIKRGLDVFDELVVAIATNVRKQSLFDVREREVMIRESVDEHVGAAARVTVASFEGLLVDYARHVKAQAILRGLRAISDFEFEFQMAHMNRRLAPEIETVFMMTGEEQFYVSSQLVREVAAFGGDVSSMVPKAVEARLVARFRR